MLPARIARATASPFHIRSCAMDLLLGAGLALEKGFPHRSPTAQTIGFSLF